MRSEKVMLIKEFFYKAVRLFYSNLSLAKNDDRLFQSAIKLARRTLGADSHGDDCENPKKSFRAAGGGRKKKANEVREELFQWFIDIRTPLKARLPRKIFVLQTQTLYED